MVKNVLDELVLFIITNANFAENRCHQGSPDEEVENLSCSLHDDRIFRSGNHLDYFHRIYKSFKVHDLTEHTVP